MRSLLPRLLIPALVMLAACGATTAASGSSAPSATAMTTPAPSPSATASMPVPAACSLLSKSAAAQVTGDTAMQNTTSTRDTCTYSNKRNLATIRLLPLTGGTAQALQDAVGAGGCSIVNVPYTVLPNGAFEIIDPGCVALAFATGNEVCLVVGATSVAAAKPNLEVAIEDLADQALTGLGGG